MRYRREDTKRINGVVLLIILIGVCFFLILGLDYAINHFDLNKSTTHQQEQQEQQQGLLPQQQQRRVQHHNEDDNLNNNNNYYYNNSNELSDKSKSLLLQQQFRYYYAEMLRRKLEKKDYKLPSEMQLLLWLSDVYNQRQEDVNFIQVGACDGNFRVSNDPIQKLLQKDTWRGVLMEPVPYLFDKLKENAALHMPQYNKRLFLMNAALSDVDGQQDFYIVNEKFALEKPQETHALKHQINSFDKNHITKHLIKLHRRGQLQHEVNYYIDIISVRSATPDTVIHEFTKSGLAARSGFVDVLLIDAEGFDFMVLKSFMKMFSLKPQIIIYETLHLTDASKKEAEKLLSENGYSVWPVGWNAAAVKIADF